MSKRHVSKILAAKGLTVNAFPPEHQGGNNSSNVASPATDK